jgi:hypothetical protein
MLHGRGSRISFGEDARNVPSDLPLSIGDFEFEYDTVDGNAHHLKGEFPTPAATDVPVFNIGIGHIDVDLTYFNGITEAQYAVTDADRDSAITFGFSADDRPGFAWYGSAGHLEMFRAGLPLESRNTSDAGGATSLQVLRLSGAKSQANVTDNDEIYQSFYLNDDAATPNQIEVVRLTARATDTTEGSVDGQFVVSVMTGGALTAMLQIDSTAAGVVTHTVPTGDIILNDNVSLQLGSAGAESDLSSNGTNTVWNMKTGRFDVQFAAAGGFQYSAGALAFQEATTVSTSTGNLTLSAAAGADVLIGDDVTLLYVDGGTGTVGIGATAISNGILHIAGSLSTNGAKGIFVNPTVTHTTTRADAELVDILGGSITVQTGVTITDLQTARFGEPVITLQGTAAATNAQIILMTAAPTEGGSNFFMRENVNGGNLSTSGVWTDGSSRDIKRGVSLITDFSPFSRLLAMVEVNEYRRENGRQDDPYLRYGMIAEDVPDFLASGNRKGIAAGYVGGFLMGVAQWHEQRLDVLEEAKEIAKSRWDALEEEKVAAFQAVDESIDSLTREIADLKRKVESLESQLAR